VCLVHCVEDGTASDERCRVCRSGEDHLQYWVTGTFMPPTACSRGTINTFPYRHNNQLPEGHRGGCKREGSPSLTIMH
jgi:hypothetical protein